MSGMVLWVFKEKLPPQVLPKEEGKRLGVWWGGEAVNSVLDVEGLRGL